MSQPAFGTYAPSFWVRTLLGLTRHTPLGRGQGRRWIGGLVRQAHSGLIDTHVWGEPARIEIGANNNEMKALLNPSAFNRSELKAMRDQLPLEDGVFVDIGANVGMVTLAARAHMRSGTLLAIEPQPDLFDRLSFTLDEAARRQSRPIRQVLENVAVGPTRTTATLRVPEQPGMASLANTADGDRALTVDVVPLTELCASAKLTHIDVLKIDIEGYEDQALAPFFGQAPEHLWPRLVIMEHCHAERWDVDLIAEMRARGYRTQHEDRQNICLERTAS